MFYVSSVSGSLVPFDPSTTPISNVPQQVPPVSEIIAATESYNAAASTDVAIENASVQPLAPEVIPQTQEAAIFEGYAIPTSRDLAGGNDSLNIGRAGAVMAYRVRESGFSEETILSDTKELVGAIQNTKTISDDSGRSPHRVNPIKKSAYQNQQKAKERKKVVVAQDIMSAPVFSIDENLSLEKAQQVFSEHKFRHIPVVSSLGKLVGIISDRDFIGRLSGQDLKKIRIKEKMITNILTARPQTEIRSIAEVMFAHRIGCLPILDDSGALKGILTRSDILRAIVNHAPIELWT